MSSFQVVVKTMDDPGWVSNKLFFATEEDANGYRIALFTQWEALVDSAIFASPESPNVIWRDRLIWLVEPEIRIEVEDEGYVARRPKTKP